jgi:hypothetical protein
LLGEKVYKAHELTYAGELITCGHCGRPITGEVVIKKATGKQYVYYRCTRYTQADHPRVRLREEELDKQIITLFEKIKQPEPVRLWFRRALTAWSTHHHEQYRARAKDVQRQLDDVRRQQERLLNLHLSGGIDEQTFSTKNTDLRDRVAKLTLQLEATDRRKDEQADLAVKVFELSQRLKDKWLTANYPEKRRILDLICLNLTLQGATLAIATRKPFNALVEGLSISDSGEGEIRTPATLSGRPVFETGAFNHSATSPWGKYISRSPNCGQTGSDGRRPGRAGPAGAAGGVAMFVRRRRKVAARSLAACSSSSALRTVTLSCSFEPRVVSVKTTGTSGPVGETRMNSLIGSGE